MALPDPNTKTRYRSNTVYGGSVYLGRRVCDHLDYTREKAVAQLGHDVSIMQGGFNTSVAASAGTHDFDRVLDVSIPGVEFTDAQRFFRSHGWAAWYRPPPNWPAHIHMVSLGGTARVGIYVPGQITDYYGHRSGLAGHVSDSSWHPADIGATVFNYAAYLNSEDDAMTEDEHKALMQIRRMVERVAGRDENRDANTVRRDQAAAARDNNLAAAIARGFDDLVKELEGSTADVKAKVNDAKTRIVGAVRTAVDDLDDSPTEGVKP